MLLQPVAMRFDYDEAFDTPPDAYETLLLDAIRGDATLFMRSDQVETAWRVVQPILDAWGGAPPAEFPNYAAGSWGPAAADRLLAHDGRAWFTPLPPDPVPSGTAPEAVAGE
jgi:glucose-6-phosphate 1-dehydrogenase